MRQYEPIWNRIKTHSHASIVTHPDNAARVIKAVTKEKHLDTGYKLLLSEDALVATLVVREQSSKVNNSITIHFSLRTAIKESYIGVHTL